MNKQQAKPKILLVDDRPENLFALEQTLNSLNADFYRANSGEEALSQVLRSRFALVLMDAKMPGMGGFEAVSLMHDHDETKNVPVILVTALSEDRQFVQQAYGTGAVDYLFKPITPDILVTKVKVFLELEKQRIELEATIRTNQEIDSQNKSILNCLDEGVMAVSEQGIIEWANPTAEHLLHQTPGNLLGSHLFNYFHFEGREHDIRWRDFSISHALVNKAQYSNSSHLMRCQDGTTFPVEFSIVSFRDDTNSGGVFSFQDITERKSTESQLIRLAQEDSLTQLPNRSLFHEFLHCSLKERMRDNGHLALLMLDLNDFKRVNDTLGHDVGDRLLQSVASRMKAGLRQGDLVARIGGDEFGIILPRITNSDDAGRVAKKVLNSFEQEHVLDGHVIMVGASIGIATFPEGGEDVQELIKAADAAMYHAKASGGNTFQFFSYSMQERVMAKDQLEQELVKALTEKQFVCHFQPKIDFDNELMGFEALVRWQHPSRGMVYPGDFIEILEETGLVVKLGEQMLEAACSQTKKWIDQKLIKQNITVAVNISVKQLSNGSLVNTIEKILAASGLPAECLELEVTEYSMMNNMDNAIKVLNQLQELGVKIAIDDFGTGYSSLTYLSKLPVSSLKIDRYFVDGIGNDKDNETIVTATINLAHSLNLTVTAEGVETDQQRRFLITNHCDYLQGYFFAKPKGALALEEWIIQRNAMAEFY